MSSFGGQKNDVVRLSNKTFSFEQKLLSLRQVRATNTNTTTIRIQLRPSNNSIQGPKLFGGVHTKAGPTLMGITRGYCRYIKVL